MRADAINTLNVGSTVWVEGGWHEDDERYEVTEIKKLVIRAVNERGEDLSFLRTDGTERGRKSRRRRRIAIVIDESGEYRLLTDAGAEERKRLRQRTHSASKLRELISQRSLRIPVTEESYNLLAAIMAVLHRDAHDGAWQIDISLSNEDEEAARARALQALIDAAEGMR